MTTMWKVLMVDQRGCLLPPIEVDENHEFVLKNGTSTKIKDTPEGELELEDGNTIVVSCSVKDLDNLTVYEPDGKGNLVAPDGTVIPDPFVGEDAPPVDRTMVTESRRWLEEHKDDYK